VSLSLDEGAIVPVIKFIRECNVTLHWLLLHTAIPTILIEDLKRSRNLKQLVLQESKYSANDTLCLLLSTAQIEDNIKQMYKQVIFTHTHLDISHFLFYIMANNFSYYKIKKISG
jgi:WASH complex subunit strumpellin